VKKYLLALALPRAAHTHAASLNRIVDDAPEPNVDTPRIQQRRDAMSEYVVG
jgi:hypothetical protein